MPHAPRVRLEIREDADTVVAVRGADDWPLPGTEWHTLYLDAAGQLVASLPEHAGTIGFNMRTGRAVFQLSFAVDSEVIGPMALRLYVQLRNADDVYLFAGCARCAVAA
jgi:predicted acyl esterase